MLGRGAKMKYALGVRSDERENRKKIERKLVGGASREKWGKKEKDTKRRKRDRRTIRKLTPSFPTRNKER